MNAFDGIVNFDGQDFILNSIQDKIDTLSNSGLYIGLLTSYTGTTTDQINNGLTEYVGTGYTRLLSTNWVVNVDSHHISGNSVEFTPTIIWKQIKGYFVSESENGNTCLWYQSFPLIEQGDFAIGFPVIIKPYFKQN